MNANQIFQSRMKLVREAHRQRIEAEQEHARRNQDAVSELRAHVERKSQPPVASPAPVPSEEPTHDDSDSTQRSGT
jgi:hypothetical protein